MRLLVLLLVLGGLARAHHGQDFFLTLDARVPELGGFTAFANASAREGEFLMEPGILAGLGGGLAAGVSLSLDDQASFGASGISPIIQWSAPLGESPLRLGAALSYHFHDSSRGLADGGHSHGGHSHRRRPIAAREFRPVPQFSPGMGFNPDAPPPPIGGGSAHHTHAGGHASTIHLHDTDFFLARLIVECPIGPATRLVGNLILGGTSSSDTALGYALAVRHEFTPRWAAGLEGIGDFNTHGYHEMVASIIYSPRSDLGLRLGIGHGLGQDAAGASVLGGMTWRF